MRTNFYQWFCEIIHIIPYEIHMDRQDKSENISGIKYQLSEHFNVYVSCHPTVSYDEIKQKVITQANDYHRVKAYTP